MSAVDDLINELQLSDGHKNGSGEEENHIKGGIVPQHNSRRHQFDNSSSDEEDRSMQSTRRRSRREGEKGHSPSTIKGITSNDISVPIHSSPHPRKSSRKANKAGRASTSLSSSSSSSSAHTPLGFCGKEGGNVKPAQKSSSKSAHFFDDEDDEVEVPPSGPSKVTTVQPSQSDGTAVSIASPSGVGVGFPVPFPTLKAETKATLMLQRCPNACVVTNIGCGVKPPTLSALCEIGKGCLGMPAGKIPQAQMMQKKGAYYAYLPDIGNGAKNNGGEAQEEGGCMHIKCLKCSYLVVRLQGVQWEDADGSLDLYLTVRNFYPDWSRLAVASPVGLEEDDGSASTQRVLSADEHSAAYCCQCSWLTVRAPRAVIRTTMMDVMPFKDKGGNCFATHLPSSDAETRRPPLWVCSGHMLQLK